MTFGTWTSGSSILALLNSHGARVARQMRLDDALDEKCRNCPRFPIISIEEYRPHIEWLHAITHPAALEVSTVDLTSYDLSIDILNRKVLANQY